jgi:hypothetical protein
MLSLPLMKQVLSLLTAFVFLQMQTWALSGGPVFPGAVGSPNMAGVYSGVMVQTDALFGSDFQAPTSGSIPNNRAPAGNIGLYSVAVPVSGIATGTTVVFINGTLFSGTLQGIADPDKRTFDGIFNLGAVPTLTAGGVAIDPIGEGQMRTKISERFTEPLPGRSTTSNGNAARMTGTAQIDVATSLQTNLTPIPFVETKYSVSGYRQTTTALP